MTTTVRETTSSTGHTRFLDTALAVSGSGRDIVSAGRQRPVVMSLKGKHPGLCCIVLNVTDDDTPLTHLIDALRDDNNALCTDIQLLLLPGADQPANAVARECYQQLVSWKPDFVIDVAVASCPQPLAFGFRQQAGSGALGSLFSPYTVNSTFSPTALTRFLWPCPCIELLLPRTASPEKLRQWGQIFTGLQVGPGDNGDSNGYWLHTVYWLDALKAASVAFSDRPVFGMNITLNLPATSKAFVTLHPGETVGWLDHNGLDHLRLRSDAGKGCLTDFFDASDNRLVVRAPLTCFLMADSVDSLRDRGVLHFSPVEYC